MKSKTALQITTLLATLLAGTAAVAQAKAPVPDYTLAYNIGVVTDYRFRGITQNNYGGALQGGIDFSHKRGFYLGAWASNVSWIKQFNGANNGSWELDLYGGYKGEIMKDLSFDVGVITYQYPGNDSGATGTPGAGGYSNASTNEFYGALTYSVATLKYSQSLGNFLGNLNSNGSKYWDLSANFDLGSGFTLTPHVGRQTIPNQSTATIANTAGDYTDYSLTLGKDFGNGISATLSVYGTNADGSAAGFYNNTFNGVTPQFIAKNGAAIGVKYSF